MRWRRQERLFISYSHSDNRKIEPLIAGLRDAGFEIIIDTDYIKPGNNISLNVMGKIQSSDCILCFGTKSSFKSDWCKQEVEFAQAKAVPYIPVLTDESLSPPDWFVDRRRGTVHYCLWSMSEDTDTLVKHMRTLTQRPPVTLLSAALMLVLLLLLGPMLIAGLVRPQLSIARRPVPDLQEWIERINNRIQAFDPQEALERESLQGLCGPREAELSAAFAVYRDKESGILVCDEYLSRRLHKRVYKRGGVVVASEEFLWSERVDGAPSFVKRRSITPHSDQGIVIEEEFDSVGNLISKRVDIERDGTWQNYNDVGRSVFPVLMALYR